MAWLVLAIPACVGVLISLVTMIVMHIYSQRREQKQRERRDAPSGNEGCTQRERLLRRKVDGFVGAIGNTPLIYLRSLSEATNCEIYGKAEFLNPGGSVKDRAAKRIIDEAVESGALQAGGTIVEGTVGSTGISLALQARARGFKCRIFMPSDTSLEKSSLLEQLGAKVTRVPPIGIYHPNHFVNLARRFASGEDVERALGIAASGDGGEAGSGAERGAERGAQRGDRSSQHKENRFFTDQFENLANFRAHYTTTGPEIHEQLDGRVDAVVMGAGTGGTISGVGQFLKERNGQVRVVLADPFGSGLYNKVMSGVMYATTEAEGKRKRNQSDSVMEGVGLNRVVQNFVQGLDFIDSAVRVTDSEAVQMSSYLLDHEGLFLGSSSCLNCVGAVKVARQISDQSRDDGGRPVIVTVLCDSGTRYLSSFYHSEYVRNGYGIERDTLHHAVDDLSFVL